MTPLRLPNGDPIPPWQITVDCTMKGTEDECLAAASKLIAAAKRLGFDPPFVESEPNCDLDYGR